MLVLEVTPVQQLEAYFTALAIFHGKKDDFNVFLSKAIEAGWTSPSLSLLLNDTGYRYE